MGKQAQMQVEVQLYNTAEPLITYRPKCLAKVGDQVFNKTNLIIWTSGHLKEMVTHGGSAVRKIYDTIRQGTA